MIVAIKRFDFAGRKISRKLKYPVVFNLKQFTSSAVDSKIKENSIPNEIYDLYGVVIHLGSTTSSGHYFAYCRGSTGKWFDCNDDCISGMSESSALNGQAYLLFYQKRV